MQILEVPPNLESFRDNWALFEEELRGGTP